MGKLNQDIVFAISDLVQTEVRLSIATEQKRVAEIRKLQESKIEKMKHLYDCLENRKESYEKEMV